MNRYTRLKPEEAFIEAALILSRTNPRELWSLLSLLSTTEAFAQKAEELLFFGVLNHERVRMLCEAALDSKALDYKADKLSAEQIIDAINYVSHAMADPEGTRLMQDLADLAGPELALQVYLSRLGNVQKRYQDPRFHERVGRLIGMFEELPRSHRHKMPAEFWAMADPALDTIARFLGFPILSMAGVTMGLLDLYRQPYRQIIASFDPQAAARAGPRACFGLLLEHRREWQSRFVVRIERRTERTALARFLELFARTTRELRELRRHNSTYRRGGIARRLSPLERYPVVWLNDKEVVVPNVRYLYRNFADIIHFSLWEEKIPKYEHVRGGLQELYLHVLIEERLPDIAIVPERPYRRGKQSVKGADLTLIENDRLVLVESKAQRIRSDTRLNMLPEELLDNLDGAVEAIKKCETKIADLYAGLPEFADFQPIIDRTRGSAPICVAVVGEEIEMMGEVMSELEKSYPNYPLSRANILYCIVGIDTFERAVEVAARDGRKLVDLLEEYMSEAANIQHKRAAAGEFGGVVKLDGMFSVSFYQESARKISSDGTE